MPTVAEMFSTMTPNRYARGFELQICPVCADSIVAAEASAYVSDNCVTYLWACDTCGYGFVTEHSPERIGRN